MLEDGVVVPLKRKVRSLETNLLEWRRCACMLTSNSSQLILELTDDDVDDVVLDDDHEDVSGGANEDTDHSGGRQGDYGGDRQGDASRRGKCRVAIDLGSALKRIEQKRKNKTRCEIEYWDPIASSSNSSSRTSSDRCVRTEELMASSARHCQQFIDQVREAERQAKRKQSIRLGAVLAAATSVSASSSGVPSSHMNSRQSSDTQARTAHNGSPSQISPPKVKTEHFMLQRGAVTSVASSASGKSSSGSVSTGGTGGALRASSLRSSGKSEEISPAAVTRAVAPISQQTAANRGFSLSDSFPSTTSSRDQHQHRRQEATENPSGDQQTQYWSQHCHDGHARDCESDTLDSSSGVISPRVTPPPASAPYREPSHTTSHPNNNSSLASSQVSCSSVSTVSKILLASKPLPQELFAQRLASLRTGAQHQQHQQQQENSDDADDDDDEDDEGFDNRRRARMEKLFSPGASSSRHAFQSSRVTGRRRPSIDLRAARERSNSKSALVRSSTISRRRNSGSPASAAALAANLNRLRLHSRTIANNNNGHQYGEDHHDDTAGDSSNRAELHILMRVEAALRQLEKENALAKEREALLSQEVQSLRDALRVKSAEKKHVETQFQQLLREKDEWKQVAQRAECAVVQMEDELLIAREEAQLLQSERVRLKHQNKELLTHVHRLDSLVYGRF